MRRRPALLALGLLAFLVISVELARFLTAESAERSAVFALIQDAARGDATAVAARLEGCDAACRRELETTVTRTRRPGEIEILRLDAGANFTLGERTARSRVAWAAEAGRGGEAVVQCVTVRRSWGPVAGASVTLLRLGAPIPPESGC